MDQHKITSNLDSRAVISFPYSNTNEELPETLKIETLQKALSSMFTNRYVDEVPEDTLKKQGIQLPDQYKQTIHDETKTIRQSWWKDGFECEVLKLGSHDWQRGKVRLKATVEIEFIPEELVASAEPSIDQQASEPSISSLDDIRNSAA